MSLKLWVELHKASTGIYPEIKYIPVLGSDGVRHLDRRFTLVNNIENARDIARTGNICASRIIYPAFRLIEGSTLTNTRNVTDVIETYPGEKIT